MVRKWKQQKAELQELCEQSIDSRKKLRLEGGGRKPSLSTIKDVSMERIARERKIQHYVSCKLITIWAKGMADEKRLSEFAASRSWFSTSMKKFNLSIGRRTTTGQLVPCDLTEKISNFVDFSKKQIAYIFSTFTHQ